MGSRDRQSTLAGTAAWPVEQSLASTIRSLPPWFYIGGALGPFAGGVIGAVLPAIRADYDADLATLSWAVPAYLVPFALFQLFSGAFSDRTSRRLTLGIGYLAFVVASLICAVAPTVAVFLAGRVLQGAANAFTTPILIAATADAIPRERIGLALGAFVAVNMAGGFAAPLVAGTLAEISWRLVYVVIAGWALTMWVLYDPWLRRLPARGQGETPSGRELIATTFNPRLLWLGAAAFLAQGSTFGSTYLWPTYLVERWNLGLAEAGAMASTQGLTGMVVAPIAGRLGDRFGPVRVIVACALLASLGGLAMGLAPTPLAFLAALAVLGVAYGGIWATMPSAVLRTLEDGRRRGTAVAVNATFRFGGSAVAPAAYTPAYSAAGGATFFIVAALAALTALTLVRFERAPVEAARRDGISSG